MADKVVPILLQTLKPIKIIKWKVNEGNSVSIGCVFLLYEVDEDDKHVVCKLKSTQAGTVHKLLVQEGDVVKPGEQLLQLQACTHPTVMRDMCAECGADLRKDDVVTAASVPMVHSVPELKVSLEQAQKIGKADVDRLLKDRKLVLLVDLDQTLIHTTNDNIPANIKDVYHFQLYGPHSPWYHTRLRPGTHRFLENMSPYFELHICTFGARNYAHMIAMFLDQDGKLFSQRILSRDECFNPTSKTANLKALFPCGDDMVCIIDDREDVWSHAANLIHVKPYHFFQHTGDINAPPGLDKHEDDDKEGVDLTKIKCDKQKKIKANGVLDQETNDEGNKTDDISENKIIEESNHIEDKVTSNVEETITNKTNNDSTVTDETNSFDDKITEETNNAEDKCTEETSIAADKVTEETNKVEDKITEETNNVEDTIMKEINNSEDKITAETKNAEVKLTEETNNVKDTIMKEINNSEGKITEESKSVEDKLIEETNNAEETIMKLIKSSDDKITEESKNIEDKLIVEVENTIMKEINNSDDKITEETNHSNDKITDQTFNAEDKSIEEINHVEDKIMKEINHIEENIPVKINNSDDKITEEINHSDEKIIDEKIHAEEKIKNEINHAEHKIMKEINHAEENTNNSDAKTNEEINSKKEIMKHTTENENQESNLSNPENKDVQEESNVNHDNEEKYENNNKDTINESEMNEDETNNVQSSFKQYSNNEKDNDLKDDELIEIEDSDDYLLYLEDILKIIHKSFYEKYDKMEAGKVPDLKKVIPEVRKNLLKDTKLVFSGLVPTHIKLEQSKAYQVARSLGAIVTQDLQETTTHLVAVRPGTAKVNAGRRKKNLKIVTPDWLWACAERWIKVDESLYTLNNKGSKNRHPPPHCSSPEHNVNFGDIQNTTLRKRTPSGRFMDTINPLMSFSSADIADMDREVEDIFNESESDGESSKKPIDADEVILQKLKKDKESEDESSSSDESLTGEHPHGWRPNENSLKRSREDDLDDESTADEFPSTKFRRGEELSSDLDIGQESNSEGSVDAPDEIDDGDWNMMGAALEREFLSNN